MNKQRGFTLTELLVTIVGIGAFGLFLCVIYAIVHFIAKFW